MSARMGRLPLALVTFLAGVFAPSFGDGSAFAKGNPALNESKATLASCDASLQGCESEVATCADDLASCQAATCGNGIVEYGEMCDGDNLQGQTCQTAGYKYGKLRCEAFGAVCAFDVNGCTNDRFVEGPTGETIIDNETGLEWERKTNDNTSVHDVDDLYAWTSTGTAPDGALFASFMNTLNRSPTARAGTATASPAAAAASPDTAIGGCPRSTSSRRSSTRAPEAAAGQRRVRQSGVQHGLLGWMHELQLHGAGGLLVGVYLRHRPGLHLGRRFRRWPRVLRR